MNKKEIIDESRLIKNPYEYTLVIPVSKYTNPKEFIKQGEDGIVVNSSFYLERVQSAKLFYSTGAKEYVYNLSDKAQRLYLYILYNLLNNKDYVQINKENYMTKNGIKAENTYREALKELIRYNFLCLTEYKTVFWINPNLFFCGNRIKKYPSNIKVIKEFGSALL